MALGHLLVRSVSFGFTGVPVQHLPIVTEQALKCVSGRQSHTNAEAPFGAHRIRIYEIVLVTILHSVLDWPGSVVRAFPICPAQYFSGHKKIHWFAGQHPGFRNDRWSREDRELTACQMLAAIGPLVL